MSGIEVAGLLLGAFPLLLSALEHYRQSAEVLEDWWQIKKEYKKCKNEIKVQELAFEHNLERFLLPLVVDDGEIAALMAEPGGMEWKDPALEDKLKSRLPKSYDLFVDTIHDIQSTVDGLKDELGVNREDILKDLDTTSDQKKRGKTRNPFGKLFRKQKQGASTEGADRPLKKWLRRPNIEYQTYRVKFAFGKANRAKLFEDFARYNARLRELLDTNDRSTALKQSRERIKNSAARKRLWRLWRHASCLHDLLSQAWCCQCKHLHRACLFLHNEMEFERINFSICFLYAPNVVADHHPWSWEEVDAQAATNPAENVFGLLKGEEESYILERRANLQPPRKTYQTVSLESLLNKTSDLSLSRRQRYQIGFTLASSHLQLYPSPWLHSQWSKREIIFKIDPQDHRSIQTDQPYILRSVSTSTQQSATTPTPSYASSDRCLPTLGILLIELCFGTALEDHEMRRQYDSTSAEQQQQQQIATADLAAALDLAVALEWARFVGGEAGEGYADAVGWCLRGQCGGLTRDDRWREELFANVVRPLMSCHEQMRSVGKGGVA